MQLLDQQLLCLSRQDSGERSDLLLDLRRIKDQPVKRDEGGQAWEQREQDRVGDAARDEKEIRLRNLSPRAPHDVHPASGGISPGWSASRPRPSLPPAAFGGVRFRSNCARLRFSSSSRASVFIRRDTP